MNIIPFFIQNHRINATKYQPEGEMESVVCSEYERMWKRTYTNEHYARDNIVLAQTVPERSRNEIIVFRNAVGEFLAFGPQQTIVIDSNGILQTGWIKMEHREELSPHKLFKYEIINGSINGAKVTLNFINNYYDSTRHPYPIYNKFDEDLIL